MLLAAAILVSPSAQIDVTAPREHLGFNFGDDYHLANYKQIAAYWQKLDARVGPHGRPGDRQDRRGPDAADGDRHLAGEPQEPRALQGHLAPARARRRADRRRRRARSRRKARRSSGSTAACTPPRRSARSSSARWSTRWSAAPTKRRCGSSNDCIILFVHANPDGNDLVADWYMRNPDPEQRIARPACRGSTRSTSATTTTATSSPRRRPRPRTSTACSITSGSRRFSTTTTRAARPGTVVWSSPQRDPYNYNLDPLLILGLQALGTHMHQRLAAEGKPGATMASGGAVRRLVERRHPQHRQLPQHHRDPDRDDRQPDADARFRSSPQRQIPNRDLPVPDRAAGVALQAVDRLLDVVQPRGARLRVAQPREPAVQHLRDGAALDRARQRGHVDAVADADADALAEQMAAAAAAAARPSATPRSGRRCASRSCAIRAATSSRRISADFPTAIKFINALREVERHRAPRDARRSRSPARRYPAGSFVVMTAQAFRPHVIDMFEPQDHPNVIPVSGRAADAAVRQRRLDAGVPDGRAVRSHPRAVHRAVREGDRLERRAAAGRVTTAAGATAFDRPPRQRRVSRGEPPARRRRARVAAHQMRSTSTPRP